MKQLLFSFMVILFAAVANAQAPSIQLEYKYNVEGEPVASIRGRGLYDSSYYMIRVTDLIEGETGWDVSASGNTSWEINSEKGTFYRRIKSALIDQPGYILEVKTYNSVGTLKHRFQIGIPNDRNAYYDIFSDTVWYDEVTSQLPPVVVVPPPASQSCDASVSTSPRQASSVDVYVNCNLTTGASVRVYDADSGTLLGTVNNLYVSASQVFAGQFPRNPNVTSKYRIEIRTAERDFFEIVEKVNKNPTYNYLPTGTYRNGLRLAPRRENKALGRGYYWQQQISAQVVDRDLIPEEGASNIKVELIRVKNGGEYKLGTSYANSGGIVSFTVEHQYIEPLIFGSPKHTGDIDMGLNTLKLRVWDAYNGNTSVDLPAVTVNVQN